VISTFDAWAVKRRALGTIDGTLRACRGAPTGRGTTSAPCRRPRARDCWHGVALYM